MTRAAARAGEAMLSPSPEVTLGRIITTHSEMVLYAGALASGVSLALAHVVPWSPARVGLSVAFLLWGVGAGFVTVSGLRRVQLRILGTERSASAVSGLRDRLLVWAVVGAALLFGVMRDIQLGLLQLLPGNADLVFNIDHRFIFMHAWSILRAGGLTESLSMAGQPVVYHTGPSWYAAALASLLGADLSVILFLIFPLVAMVTIVVATVRIIRATGMGLLSAAAGVAFVLMPMWDYLDPDDPVGRARFAVRSILDGEWGQVLDPVAWTFLDAFPLPTQMLNALLGTALILAAAAQFVRSGSKTGIVLATAGIVVAMIAKPQYVAAGPAILLAAVLVIAGGDRRRAAFGLGFASLSAILGLALTQTVFSGSELVVARIAPDSLAWPSTWRAVRPFLPTQAVVVLGVIVLAGVLTQKLLRRRADAALEARVLIPLGVLLGSMVAFWVLLNLLVAAGGPELEEWAWGSMTGLGPTAWLATALSAAWLFSWAQARRVTRVGALIVIALGLFVSVHHFTAQFREPLSGHEAVDSAEIRELLGGIDPREATIMTSDLADPDEDYGRRGRAFYLSLPFGHRYWLTQTDYGHQGLLETSQRLEGSERFFASDWSLWHVDHLSDNGITHIIVHDRCPAPWQAEVPVLLRTLNRTPNWTAYEVLPPSGLWVTADPGLPDETPVDEAVSPEYGRAPCR